MATQRSVMAVIRAAQPTFRHAHDKVAFAIHATFLASGHVLHATGIPAFSDDALYSTSTDEVGIDGWTAIDDYYGFVYSIPDDDSKKVLLKCLVMNNFLHVDALADGPNCAPVHLSLNVEEFDREEGATNYGSQYKNLEELITNVEREILCKLVVTSTVTPLASSSGRELADTELHCPQATRYYPAGVMYNLQYPLFVWPPAGMYPNSGPSGTSGSMAIDAGPGYYRLDWTNVSIYTGLPDFGLGQQPRGSLAPPSYPFAPRRFPGFDRNRFNRNSGRSTRGTNPDPRHNQGG